MSTTEKSPRFLVVSRITVEVVVVVFDPYPDSGESGDAYDAEMTYAV